MDWESCVERMKTVRTQGWSGRFPVHERVVARELGFRGNGTMPAHRQLREFIAVCKKGKYGAARESTSLSCT